MINVECYLRHFLQNNLPNLTSSPEDLLSIRSCQNLSTLVLSMLTTQITRQMQFVNRDFFHIPTYEGLEQSHDGSRKWLGV